MQANLRRTGTWSLQALKMLLNLGKSRVAAAKRLMDKDVSLPVNH
jgi:hypothetical protein